MTNDNYFFSIIVTVYNNSKYIEKCLDSIIPYLKSNYELIIVNDGSTDNSLKLCKEKIKNISNCSIISQLNGGVSSARNVGIKSSSGEYLIFIDGDDWIFGNVFCELERCISNANPDFVLMNTIKYIEKDNNYIVEKMFFPDDLQLVEKNLYNLINNKVFGRAWRFIVSKKLINKEVLLFHEGLIFEDEEWSIKLVLSSRNMLYFNQNYYVYRKTNNTITSSKTFEKYLDLLEITISSYNWCLERDLTINQKRYYRKLLFRCIRNIYGSYTKFSNEQKKYIKKWNKGHQDIISDILLCNLSLFFLAKFISPIYLFKLYKSIKHRHTKKDYIRLEESKEVI